MTLPDEIEKEIMNQVAHLRWAASQGREVHITDVEDVVGVYPISPTLAVNDADGLFRCSGVGAYIPCKANGKCEKVDTSKITWEQFFGRE